MGGSRAEEVVEFLGTTDGEVSVDAGSIVGLFSWTPAGGGLMVVVWVIEALADGLDRDHVQRGGPERPDVIPHHPRRPLVLSGSVLATTLARMSRCYYYPAHRPQY